MWWVAGGCALLLVLGVVGGIAGVISLANSFQRGGLSCLPSDFPKYPGVTVQNQRTYVGTGVPPGDTRSCNIALQSNDDVATVTAFYSEQLHNGDWKVTNFDRSSGQIKFQRVSRPLTIGTVELLGRGQHTEIRIELYS
jgi:hypothetical protein